MDLQNIKVFIFDLDGLLLDTEIVYNKCWREAAQYCGYNLTYENALELRSLDSKLAQQFLFGLFGDDFNYASVKQKRNKLMKQYFAENGIKAKKGTKELLNFCKENDYKITIASASDESQIYEKLNIAGIYTKFDYIVSTKSLERGKPYPDIYIHTCNQLNVSPIDVLVFEDSPNGIKAAYNAGCNVIMIPDLTMPDSEISYMITDTLNSLYDFLLILQ